MLVIVSVADDLGGLITVMKTPHLSTLTLVSRSLMEEAGSGQHWSKTRQAIFVSWFASKWLLHCLLRIGIPHWWWEVQTCTYWQLSDTRDQGMETLPAWGKCVECWLQWLVVRHAISTALQTTVWPAEIYQLNSPNPPSHRNLSVCFCLSICLCLSVRCWLIFYWIV